MHGADHGVHEDVLDQYDPLQIEEGRHPEPVPAAQPVRARGRRGLQHVSHGYDGAGDGMGGDEAEILMGVSVGETELLVPSSLGAQGHAGSRAHTHTDADAIAHSDVVQGYATDMPQLRARAVAHRQVPTMAPMPMMMMSPPMYAHPHTHTHTQEAVMMAPLMSMPIGTAYMPMDAGHMGMQMDVDPMMHVLGDAGAHTSSGLHPPLLSMDDTSMHAVEPATRHGASSFTEQPVVSSTGKTRRAAPRRFAVDEAPGIPSLFHVRAASLAATSTSGYVSVPVGDAAGAKRRAADDGGYVAGHEHGDAPHEDAYPSEAVHDENAPTSGVHAAGDRVGVTDDGAGRKHARTEQPEGVDLDGLWEPHTQQPLQPAASNFEDVAYESRAAHVEEGLRRVSEARAVEVKRAQRSGGVLQSPLLRVIHDGRPLVTPEELQAIKSTLELHRGKRSYRPWTALEKMMIVEALSHELMDNPHVRQGKWEFIQVYGWHTAFSTNYRTTVDIRCAAERMVAANEMPTHIVTKLLSANFVGGRKRGVEPQRALKKMVNAAYESMKRHGANEVIAAAVAEAVVPGNEAGPTLHASTAHDETYDAAVDDKMPTDVIPDAAHVAAVDSRHRHHSLAPGQVPGHSSRLAKVRLERDPEHVSRVAAPGSNFTSSFTVPMVQRVRDFLTSALRTMFPGVPLVDGSMSFQPSDMPAKVTFTLSRLPHDDIRTLEDVQFGTDVTVVLRALAVAGQPAIGEREVVTDKEPEFEQLLQPAVDTWY